MNKQKRFTLIIIVLILLISAGIWGTYYLINKQSQKQATCTQEAKICSDGSSVGRTGPNCEFETCPINETANWSVYTNEELGYEIKYPNDWIYREYPDTKDGAGFRPINIPNEVQYEFINIAVRVGVEMNYSIPFIDYVKEAATKEIQNFKELNSIKEITTATGIKGYETTWIYYNMGSGKEEVSLPITYFDYKKTFGLDKYITIQVSLDNDDYKEIYEQMILTFKFLE